MLCLDSKKTLSFCSLYALIVLTSEALVSYFTILIKADALIIFTATMFSLIFSLNGIFLQFKMSSFDVCYLFL